MKITKKQLTFLEDYIKRKKAFLDTETRLELIDHLVCDFEENGNGNISQFLADKATFIFNYKNTKSEEIHWAYQRELWKVFFRFFTNLKMLSIVFLVMVLFYQLITNFSLKVVMGGYLVVILAPTILGFIKTYHKKKEIRNLIEFKYLANIMALPHVFLYALSAIKEFLFPHHWLILIYLTLGVLLNFAGIMVVLEKRKRILTKYNHLIN